MPNTSSTRVAAPQSSAWYIFSSNYSHDFKAVHLATSKTFELPISQGVIGDVLGLSGPHVNRVLRQLRMDGLVTIDGRTVTLHNLPTLQTMTQFEVSLTRANTVHKRSSRKAVIPLS